MAKKEEKAAKPKRTRKIWWRVVLGCVAMGVVLAGVIGYAVWWNTEGSKTELEKRGLPDRGLPVMEITLADGLELAEIDGGDKDVKYEGNEVDLYEGGSVFEFDDVEVKGRGNSTWGQEKKPYQLSFSRGVDLLGLGKAKKWVLLANALDASYLRNDIALTLAEMVGMPYNHRGDFVELYVNDDYRGLYYLVQKIAIAKGSVDLRNDGGLLFEIDTLHKNEENCYTTYLEECLVLKDERFTNGEGDNLVKEFLEDLNEAERAAKKGRYYNVAEISDIDSFVQYFLVNEFTVNPDAYTSSFYLYRNDEGKIAAGPVWDFDLALANEQWIWWTDRNFFSPYEDMVRRKNVFGEDGLEEDISTSKLMYYLLEMPEFRDRVNKMFQERMSGRKEEFMRMISSRVEKIYRAVKADGERWEGESFEEELTALLKWVKGRYEHFEEVYGDGSYDWSGVI